MSHVVLAGIDPGSQTGVVLLKLPARSRRLEDATWAGSFRVHGAEISLTRSKEEGRVLLFERLRDALKSRDVREVVIECPSDALSSWRPNQVGTAFGLGANYGLCLAACRSAGVQRIAGYQVSTNRKHVGWMPMVREPSKNNPNKLVTHVQRRDITLAQLKARMQQLFVEKFSHGRVVSLRAEIETMCEDEIMAFGVLQHHLSRFPLPPDDER